MPHTHNTSHIMDSNKQIHSLFAVTVYSLATDVHTMSMKACVDNIPSCTFCGKNCENEQCINECTCLCQ